jgi:hypothetical protein
MGEELLARAGKTKRGLKMKTCPNYWGDPFMGSWTYGSNLLPEQI